MSDLTPEETVRAASVPTVDEYTCEQEGLHVPLGVALAAVAAERERIVKLLRDEADRFSHARYNGFHEAADLVAREGDTTGSNE